MKIGPWPELEVAVALVPDRRAGHVRGHEIRGELDAREPHAEDLGEGAGGERLREARVVLEQDVPVGEEPEQNELERIALADDGLFDLVEDVARERLNPCELHGLHVFQCFDDVGERLRREPAPEPILRCSSVGTDELPGRVTEHVTRRGRA